MAAEKSFVLAVLASCLLAVPSSALMPSLNNIKYITGLGTLLSSNDDTEDHSWPPSFCNGFDCPWYTTNSTRWVNTPLLVNYMTRDYSASVWASTSGSDSIMDGSAMFMRLFRYIGGNNMENMKIDMTVPVLTQRTVGEDGELDGTRTMSFYIPNDHTAPTPHDESVIVHTMNNMRVYVRNFTGMATRDAVWREHAEELEMALDYDGRAFHRDHYYQVEYDSPMKFWNRYNEIWYIAA